jgi:hypothetical protein
MTIVSEPSNVAGFSESTAELVSASYTATPNVGDNKTFVEITARVHVKTDNALLFWVAGWRANGGAVQAVEPTLAEGTAQDGVWEFSDRRRVRLYDPEVTSVSVGVMARIAVPGDEPYEFTGSLGYGTFTKD